MSTKILDEDGVVLLSTDIKTLSDATYPANAAIASAYNSSSAYNKEDYCLYSGLVYKCNTAIASGGEPWTAAHWTQVNITDELQTKASNLVFLNTTVLTSAFVSDATYAEFPYRAAVTLSGVTDTMIPEVIFSLTDSVAGIFAPTCESYNGGIYVYSDSVPEDTVTIPTIICWIV